MFTLVFPTDQASKREDRERKLRPLSGKALTFAAIFVAYILAGELGLAIPLARANLTPFWPAAAVSLAALLVLGMEFWPAIMLADLTLRIFHGYKLIPSLGISIANVLEPIIGTWFLQSLDFNPTLRRLRDVSRLIFFGAIVAPAAAGALWVAFRWWTLHLPLRTQLQVWFAWIGADAVSILLLAPAILVWHRRARKCWQLKSVAESIVAFAALIGVDALVFGMSASNPLHDYAVARLAFPFVIWLALRVGAEATMLGILSTGLIAIWGTIHGTGPFVSDPIFPLHIFLAVLAFIGLVIAATISEHRESESSLKASQEQLRINEQRYRDLFENAQDFIATIDLEGRFTDVNNSVLRVSGYSRDEFLRMRINDVVAESSREAAWSAFRSILKGDKPQGPIRLEMILKDGSILPVEISSRRLCQSGTPVGIQSIGRDVSWRKRLEEERLRSQKMEAVGRLAGGVAHDFNNLLGVILGYSDLSLQELHTDDPLRRNICEIRKAGKRAAEVTRQLLAFSRKQVLSPKVIDLNSIVGETSKMLLRLLGEDIQVTTKLAPSPMAVETDPAQMQQVIINLALNSRDAMPQGGQLVLETSSVVLDRGHGWTAFEPLRQRGVSIVPGRYVLLAVTDTGSGMDDHTKAKIFEPFFTTKPTGEGTGLGLATVYGFVRQSGGYIGVYSEVGHGTTFKIYLPEKESPVYAIAHEEAIILPKGSETVLLVEDEQSLRELNRELMQSLGYTVLAASNGADALQMSAQHNGAIDLMLTDVVMPGMSGRELAERLALIRPRTKVIYMSGYTDNVIVKHGILEHGIDFLQKPFTQERLARKLREVLGRSENPPKEGA